MIGRQDRRQKTLFVTGSLDRLIPDDHILKRVDKLLDLSWLRSEVESCYCTDNGRPGIDPEAAVRLMLAGFFQGIVHDRKLMREAQVNLAIRWFAGYQLHEDLPNHSSLTRIRQRWGAELFKRIFKKTVKACIKAGLVSGETVHIDATLIRADVSWESLTTDHAEKVLNENDEAGESKPRRKKPKSKKRSKTDPDATMSTSSKKQRLEPSYKQHTASDDKAGVIVDVELTTGEENEGKKLNEVVERIEETTGIHIKRVTADAGYAHSANYDAMEKRGTEAIIPPPSERKTSKRIPLRRFKYDSKHKVVRCPGGKKLMRTCETEAGWIYRAKNIECTNCVLRKRCIPPRTKVRTVLIVHGYEALLRARRRKRHGWDKESNWWYYNRHRNRVEGAHGEAKTQHGLRRAVRRGLDNVAIQMYLTAAVMNLKRLAALLRLIYAMVKSFVPRFYECSSKHIKFENIFLHIHCRDNLLLFVK